MVNYDDYEMDMEMSSEEHQQNAMGNFSPIPEGKYSLIIDNAGWKDSKTEGNAYLNLQFKVIDGEYKGRVIFCMLNLINSNIECKKAAQAELRQLLDAAGWDSKMKPKTNEFPGMIVDAHVVVGDEFNGKRSNDIKEFLAGNTKKTVSSGGGSNASESVWG